jgi:hypothetical protein
MAQVQLPFFGELDSNALEDYYQADIEYNGLPLQLDINFEETRIVPQRVEFIGQFIRNLKKQDAINMDYIKDDYEDGNADTVKEYLQHHLQELSGISNPTPEQEKDLMKKLRLVRVGLYPHSDSSFATFDYSIDPEKTQYLVVVNTDEEGNLDYMTMES